MKERVSYFDNLKFLLIFLVFLGHFISPLKGDVPYVSWLYGFIYLFHMPIFIFVTGYFSKSLVKDGKLVKTKFLNYMLLYLIITFLLQIIFGFKFTLVNPKLGLWYFLCIFMWNLLLPIFDRMNKKYLFIISIVCALIAGFDDNIGSILTLSRAIVFLPFFLLGYYAKEEDILKRVTSKNRIIALCVLVTVIVGLLLLPINYRDIIMLSYGKSSYFSIELGSIGIIYRAVWYVLVFIVSACVMVFVPKQKNIFTKFGSKTLQVFCIHIFLYFAYESFKLYKYFDSIPMLICLFVIIFVLTCILSMKIFSYPFDKIMGVKFKWLFDKK